MSKNSKYFVVQEGYVPRHEESVDDVLEASGISVEYDIGGLAFTYPAKAHVLATGNEAKKVRVSMLLIVEEIAE